MPVILTLKLPPLLYKHSTEAGWQEGAAWIAAIVSDLNVPPLQQLTGLKEEQVIDVCEATAGASSTKGNPIVLGRQDLERILREAL